MQFKSWTRWLKTYVRLGPAVSVMAMSLDSHVVDRGSRPGPGGLKLMPGVCACVPKIARGEWRRRDCGVAIPPGGEGDFSLSVSLSLSVWRAHAPYSKNLSKKKKLAVRMFMLQSLLFHFSLHWGNLGKHSHIPCVFLKC